MYILKESIQFDLNKSTDSRFPLKDLKEMYDWKLEYMTPEQFLFYCDYKRYEIDLNKVNNFKKQLQTTNTKIPVPILIFGTKNKSMKTTFHDGQHRVLALKDVIDKIPVLCFYEK